MKPFYGIDRTENKKNTTHEGACFIAATISDMTRQTYESTMNAGNQQLDKAKLPTVLRWIKTGCGILFGIGFISTIKALGDITLLEAYNNAPWLFWIEGACAVIWLILALLGRIRANAISGKEDFQLSLRRVENVIDQIRRELLVPTDAKDVDVIQITHRWKNGKLKNHTKGMETSPYTNIEMKVFRREDMLCLTDLENRYELPISTLRRLRRVKKGLCIYGWNKAERGDSEFYKPYKLAFDSYGRVSTRAYGLLELHYNGEDWAVWLPPYELNYISAPTGLTITED